MYFFYTQFVESFFSSWSNVVCVKHFFYIYWEDNMIFTFYSINMVYIYWFAYVKPSFILRVNPNWAWCILFMCCKFGLLEFCWEFFASTSGILACIFLLLYYPYLDWFHQIKTSSLFPGLMGLPLGLQLCRAEASYDAVAGSAVGSAVGHLVTKSSVRHGFYLVPAWMGLLSVPCSAGWHWDKSSL